MLTALSAICERVLFAIVAMFFVEFFDFVEYKPNRVSDHPDDEEDGGKDSTGKDDVVSLSHVFFILFDDLLLRELVFDAEPSDEELRAFEVILKLHSLRLFVCYSRYILLHLGLEFGSEGFRFVLVLASHCESSIALRNNSI